MAALIGSIFARLQADASGLASGLRLAGSKVSLFEQSFAGSLGRVDRRWAKTSSLIGGGALALATKAGAAIVPLLSTAAAIQRVNSELERYGEINDQAAAAGVDSEFFQGLAFNAKLAGVETDALAGALSTFAKNAGQASAEYGRLLTALQKLAPERVSEFQAARTQEERIRAVADAISSQTDASRQAALASAAFGDQGAKLVAILKGGAVAVDEMVAKAKEMGAVVDRDMIARADEWGDKLDTANEIIQTKINRSLVQLAPLMVTIGGLTADWIGQLAIVVDHFQAIEDRQFLRPLQNELANTYNAMQPVKDRIAEIEAALAGGGPNGMILKLDLADAKSELAALTEQANKLLGRIQELQGYKPPSTTAPALNADGLAGMLGRGGDGRIKPPTPFYDPSETKSRSEAASATIRQAEALAELVANLDFEASLVGKSAAEQRALTELRQAGVSATSAEGKAIKAKIIALEEEADAQAKLAEELDFYKGTFSAFILDIKSGLLEGASLWDTFANAAYDALNKIADKALGLAADGIFDTLFGSLFGGFSSGGFVGGGKSTNLLGGLGLYDAGGYTGIGGKYQPAGIVHKGEYVFDAEAVRRIGVNNLERLRGYADGGFVRGAGAVAAGSNPGAGMVFAPTYKIDARGSPMSEAQFRRALRENDDRIKAQLPRWLADARRRGAA